jgi:hypothetical protein
LPTVSLDSNTSRTTREQPWPLEGGTLAISHDGHWALASQPDRSTVAVVDLAAQRLLGEIPLPDGARPGRIAQGGDETFWIVLKGLGGLASFHTETMSGHLVKNVCAAPSGIAFDGDATFVACEDGTLVMMNNETVVTKWNVAPDARDVVAFQHHLYVSRFKTAQLVDVKISGEVLQTITPSSMASADGRTFSPNVGWRAIWSSGGPLLLHQESQMTAIVTDGLTGAQLGTTTTTNPPTDCSATSSYNGATGCGGNGFCERPVVNTVVTEMGPGGVGGTHFVGGSVGVDIAYDPQSNSVAVASAGSHAVMTSTLSNINDVCDPGFAMTSLAGRPVAVAFTPGGLTVVQTRNPATLTVLHGGPIISLPVEPDSAGFDLFNTEATPRGIACASCHPAGLEDGHTWQFVPQGARRTQSLAGGISASAPYHWDGAFADMPTLLTEVMVNRMGGAPVLPAMERSLLDWLDTVPTPTPRRDPADPAVIRGRALFTRADVGCSTCHTSPRPKLSFDVGTGRSNPQAFQVPNLAGVSARLPLMHDGCAATLAARFDPACGGSSHGGAGLLSAAERDDLIAYLESL